MTKDVEDLISRLGYHSEHPVTGKLVLTNPDGPEAASALSSLSLRVEELGRLPTEMQLLDAFSIHELEPSIVIKVRGIIRDVFRSARLRTAAVDNGSVRGREGE
jgi:hypothetical protein